jgi:hypothetical protein
MTPRVGYNRYSDVSYLNENAFTNDNYGRINNQIHYRENDNQFERRYHQVNNSGGYGMRFKGSDNIKIPIFTGREDWQVWIARFETIADRYHWNDEDRLDQLLPRIEGQAAQFLFGQLPKAVLKNYREVVKEMHYRFRVVETSRAYAAKFSRRNQKPGETAEDYAADLKMLYDKAHGFRDRQTREEDLVRKFFRWFEG